MNYKKVIKDLKERNDKLQEQYRLRDIRCIHLEYENEMLKGDFEAQHELTKKYAKENKELKEELEKKYNKGYERGILDTVEENQRLDKENRELKKQLEVGEQQYNDLVEEKEILQEQLSIKTLHLEELKLSKRDYTQENILTMQLELKNRQQKEFIEYLTSYIDLLSNKPDLIEENQKDILEEILSKYKEIIGNDINVGTKGDKDE